MLGPTEVAPGVARVSARTPTLPPATHTNSYALGEGEVLLVEPATPDHDELREWLAWARGLASAGRTLVGILATHHHHDHVAGLPVLARELALPVYAHARTAARLAHAGPARHLAEGDTLDLAGPTPARLRVLHTPGHAAGHLCILHEPSGALVVGDMVATEGTILIALGEDEGDMAEYLAQLRRLAGLGARVALPAHGEPVEDPRALFERYVAHRLAREARVLTVVRRVGGGTLDELVPSAYADVPPALYPLGRMSLEAHLAKLMAEGLVARDADGRYVARAPD